MKHRSFRLTTVIRGFELSSDQWMQLRVLSPDVFTVDDLKVVEVECPCGKKNEHGRQELLVVWR